MTGRVVICADDYGISEGTSTVILELLESGAINATTCLVETATWPLMADQLRALASRLPRIGIGLHLNLTEQFGNNVDPDLVRPIGYWLASAFRPVPRGEIDTVLASFREQWAMFLRLYGREPDFIDGHQHVQLFGPAREALLRLVMETGFKGWVRQSGTSGPRFLAQRILMDPMSAKLTGKAKAIGVAVNPGFGGLRRYRRDENLARIWGRDLIGLRDSGGLMIVHPGTEGSPPGTESIDLCRIDEAEALRKGMMVPLMSELGLGLVEAAGRPVWAEAA